MRSVFLLSCLVLALAAVDRPQEREAAAVQTPSYHDRNGGLFSFMAQQAVEMSTLRSELSTLRGEVSALRDEMSLQRGQLSSLEQTAITRKNMAKISNAAVSQLRDFQGSTFVHWGRKSCPNDTTLVYNGYVGAKKHDHKGGGTNYLCLPKTPQFDDTPYKWGSELFGVEYEIPGPTYDHDMPCSVCRAPQSTTIMMPAVLTCPAGWTPQYTGHLTAANSGHYATEYVCLDEDPEHVLSGHKTSSGALIYLVKISCHSLPCPAYTEGKVLTCVVCSK